MINIITRPARDTQGGLVSLAAGNRERNAAARYGELNYRISRTLADADERPLWYRGDYFADRFAPTAPRASR